MIMSPLLQPPVTASPLCKKRDGNETFEPPRHPCSNLSLKASVLDDISYMSKPFERLCTRIDDPVGDKAIEPLQIG